VCELRSEVYEIVVIACFLTHIHTYFLQVV